MKIKAYSLYDSDVKAFSGRIIDAMFFGCSFPFSCASHICRSQLWSGRRGRDWSGWCTPRRDKRWGRIRTCALTCRHTTVGDMDSGHAFRPFIYPCGGTGAIPLPQRHITGPCRGFPQAKAPGPCRECPQARTLRPCRDALKPRHRAMGAAHLDAVKLGFDFLTACDRGCRKRTRVAPSPCR